MSSRSAGGRRRQLQVKEQANAARIAAIATAPQPVVSTIAPTPPNKVGIYMPPSPSMQFQPLTPPMKPFAPAPLIIANPDDKWHTQRSPGFHYPSPLIVQSNLPYNTPRMLSPGSSPEFVSPISTSSSFQSLSPILSSNASPQSTSPAATSVQMSPPPSLLLQQSQSRTSNDAQTFVYPTCRSGAHPSNSSPTSATFPKLSIMSSKKKGKDSGDIHSLVDSQGGDNHSTSSGGRFRALLRRSKKSKKIKPLPTISPPSPLPAAEESSTRPSTMIVSRDALAGHGTSEGSLLGHSWIKKQDMTLHPYPNDAPYMRAYDPPFLECDRQTTVLLRRLNPRGSPSFHDYGNNPPNHVLDLGCGTGHWAVEAAMFWQSEGTRVTGFDLVDLTSDTWNRGSAPSNVRFVRGNFVKYRLPFPDKTFDLVRIANLTLAIPYAKWESILVEVRRVMTIGGRLELIDDQMLFPYAKPAPPHPPGLKLPPVPPRLRVPIPSHSLESQYEDDESDFDPLRLYSSDDDDRTSSSGPTVSGDADSIIVNTSNPSYGHGDEDNDSMLANPSISSKRSYPPPAPRHRTRGPGRALPVPPPTAWEATASTAQGLETVFETMLNERYGVHPRPSEFLLEVLRRVFGTRHASLMRSLHVELAPTELHADSPVTAQEPYFSPFSVSGDNAAVSEAVHSPRGRALPSLDPLAECPGIVLWPATFIPIPQPELEWHALKHVRMLLGCKAALADYVELRDADGVRVVDEEFWDALHDYEGFIRQRFDGLPRAPDARFDPIQSHARKGSVVSTDSASVYQESVVDYQDLLRQRFDMPDREEDPDSDADAESLGSSPVHVFHNYDGYHDGSPVHHRQSAAITSPPYTPQKLTHIRTLRIFEAIKLSEETSH